MIFRRAELWMPGLVCGAVLGFGLRAGAQVQVMTSSMGGEQQLPASAYGTGTVSGHVVCGDTQRLARFATVSLVPKPAPAKANPQSSAAPTPQSRRQNRQQDSEEISLQMVQGKTGLDGSFEIQKLPAGDYYAVASMPGYVLSLVDSGGPPDPEHVDIDKVLANYPLLHVDANHSSSVELTMQRGAVIAGRVVFDDGSPAANVNVSVKPADGKDSMWQIYGAGLQMLTEESLTHPPRTDDDGHYRIAGLQPGKYIVSATLQVQPTMRMAGGARGSTGRPDHNDNSSPLIVYAPGVFRKSEAKPVEVHAGEVNSMTDVQMNLSGLHHVSGRVLAASDRHPFSDAVLTLSMGRDFVKFASTDEDGSFYLNYVPEGSYTLNVHGFDREPNSKPEEEPKILRVYVSPKTPLIIAGQDVLLGEILLTAGKMSDIGMMDDIDVPQ